MSKVDIAGLKVDAISKAEFLEEISQRLAAGRRTFVVTAYSEFLFRGLKRPDVLAMLNGADFILADGIGLLWAKRYLDLALTAGSRFGKALQAAWQLCYTLAAVLLCPSWIKIALPEKIPGADLVWDLAGLAAGSGRSVYLLGGFGDTPDRAAAKLAGRYPGLRLAASAKNPDDPTVLADISAARPDILLVAYGPIVQEQWIAAHLPGLPVKLAIGLGGTFDYLAGRAAAPPRALRRIGLEWLWRLLTQPWRLKRIWQATAGLAGQLAGYKIKMAGSSGQIG
ncbi:MAG TPA: WecB/TagA/CpsF family glycosyltransferase [Patescibacteria group bacterium]|nr:WecB/TagA/CpsF family glycosyltransferase [Patescibacteria group bacterium]